MTLSDDQDAALGRFKVFLTRPEEPAFLLRGYAGTGKTTYLRYLVQKVVLYK